MVAGMAELTSEEATAQRLAEKALPTLQANRGLSRYRA
jgi:hypothetical protein